MFPRGALLAIVMLYPVVSGCLGADPPPAPATLPEGPLHEGWTHQDGEDHFSYAGSVFKAEGEGDHVVFRLNVTERTDFGPFDFRMEGPTDPNERRSRFFSIVLVSLDGGGDYLFASTRHSNLAQVQLEASPITVREVVHDPQETVFGVHKKEGVVGSVTRPLMTLTPGEWIVLFAFSNLQDMDLEIAPFPPFDLTGMPKMGKGCDVVTSAHLDSEVSASAHLVAPYGPQLVPSGRAKLEVEDALLLRPSRWMQHGYWQVDIRGPAEEWQSGTLGATDNWDFHGGGLWRHAPGTYEVEQRMVGAGTSPGFIYCDHAVPMP